MLGISSPGWRAATPSRSNSDSAPLVIVAISSGLGNQMFQYAAARRLALGTGAHLKLDISGFAHDPLREYGLDVFNIQAEMASAEEIQRLRDSNSRGARLLRALGVRKSRTHVREKTLEFDPSLLTRRGDTYLDGYWGYQDYFIDMADQIRRDFTVRVPPSPANAVVAEQIRATTAVCVLVRRGDYVWNPAVRRRLGLCELPYYEQAIDEMLGDVPDAHFYFFSDEPEWVRDSFRLAQPHTVVDANLEAPHESMRLMSFCKHHIISNSTFGWWGAWLAQHPGQIIIAPSPWTRIRYLRGKDRLPAYWRVRPISGPFPPRSLTPDARRD